MIDEQLLQRITKEVKRQITVMHPGNRESTRISQEDQGPFFPEDPAVLAQMKNQTNARIGVGKAGARLRTREMWNLTKDQVHARDSVFKEVAADLVERMHLFEVSSMCKDKNEHLTRPDLGRIIHPKGVTMIKGNCIRNPKVQIYVSDGLSSQAIEDNAEDMLPVLLKGLTAGGITVGTPFFMKFGRVPAMDMVAELVNAEVVCVLIGERPGLAAAGSMSAYIAYQASIGMPEARRTVVSNIHKEGTPAVEAGAYCVGLIETILKAKKSGVELQL